MNAVETNNLAIAELLIKNGANLDIQGDDGSALVVAVKRRDIALIELLIKNGANLDLQGDDGSALVVAVKRRDIALIELLIKNGANLDTQDKSGETALMSAILFDNIAAAKLLIESGANPFIQDRRGGDALKTASKENKEVIVELLYSYGKSFIESKLDFSNILNSETNIENFLKSFPNRVTMTKKQINRLGVLSGYDRNGEIRQLLNFFFVNIERLGGLVAHKVYSYLFTAPYIETTESIQLMTKIKSKEIILFEEKYLNTANAIQHYCDLPIDIMFDIICHTDEIAPCRIELLYSVLKQQV